MGGGFPFNPTFISRQIHNIELCCSTRPYSLLFCFHLPFWHSVHPIMDDSLDTILGNAGVDPALASNLVSDGWTVTSFREIAASPSDFTDQVFAELCHDVSLSLLQKSCIKGAWRSLQAPPIQEANVPAGTSSAAGTPSATDNTWSESFPPKLTSSTVSQLKMKFCANFPSEVVTP